MANQETKLKESQLSDGIPVSNIQLPMAYSTRAKVVKIHDGDSCHLHILYNNELQRYKCRLAEINTPELGQQYSLVARDYLAHLCTGGGEDSFNPAPPRYTEAQLQNLLNNNKRLVYATFSGRGYYNRALVTLYRAEKSNKSFNAMLVEKGYAKNYP